MKFLTILGLVLSFTSCNKDSSKEYTRLMEKTYLALGDSYTIGEAVQKEQSFPYQLTAKLNDAGLKMSEPEIIATTGWTTDELIKAIAEKKLQKRYDLVTLLIGVNNQYRGYSKEIYRKEFKELLSIALNYAGGKKDHVIVVSIPDWGVTPFARNSNRDLDKISREIDQFNAINREESLAIGIKDVDITPGSRLAASDVSLIADDGLHPSGRMYAEWAEKLSEMILKFSY